MPEEFTTPDLVGAIRASVEAVNRRDFDTSLAIYTPDSVWDTSSIRLGVYEGREVMREFFEGWVGARGHDPTPRRRPQCVHARGAVRRSLGGRI
jgi:ketosteroid isomerase-like protein